MNNLEHIMDGRNGVNDELRYTAISEFAAIYFKVNSNTNILFMRIGEGSSSNFIHFVNGVPYNYDIFPEANLGELISQLDSSYRFDDPELEGVKSYMRIFATYEEMQMFVLPTPKDSNVCRFAEAELETLQKKIAKTIPSEEETEEFNNFQNELNKNVLEVLSVLSAQRHNPKSLSFVMTSIDSALRGFPLSEVTSDDEWIEDEETSVDNVKNYFNKRCPNVVKRVETTTDEDGTKNETIKYQNSAAVLFTAEGGDGKKMFFNPELSVEDIELPWKYGPTKVQRLPESELTNENGFIEFKI